MLLALPNKTWTWKSLSPYRSNCVLYYYSRLQRRRHLNLLVLASLVHDSDHPIPSPTSWSHLLPMRATRIISPPCTRDQSDHILRVYRSGFLESVVALPDNKLCNVANVCLLLWIKAMNIVLTMGTLSLIMPSAIMVSLAYCTLPLEDIGLSLKDESKLRDALPPTFDQACHSAPHPPQTAGGELDFCSTRVTEPRVQS